MPQVLVIDDTEANRALAQAALEDDGFRVVTAASGQKGLEAFTAARPDCVLLDVRMAGEDGFTVCERLRALPGGAETPVLFVTALRDVDTFDRAQRAGGDDFLTKPVRPTELVMRVRAAIKLKRMSDALGEQVQLVRRQRDDLMRLQLQRERLMSFVVHDLKNPLHSMDLLAQHLAGDEHLDAQGRESAGIIRAEIRTLLRLVRNLLDVSRSDEGALTLQRTAVDLGALVHEVVDGLARRAQLHEVRLAADVQAQRLTGDAELLRRVLENLIENAIRHAPSGTAVTVATRAVRTEAGAAQVEVTVRDLGPGVPPALRERVFERYVRLDADAQGQRRDGHGLGLAFCKLAVEAHGGTIAVEDGAPGALFRVRVPHDA